MLDVSDFIYSTYMLIHPEYMHVKYLAYIPNNNINTIMLIKL